MRILLQLSLIMAVCLAGNAISSILPFTFPGSIIAMLLLFALFCLKLVRVESLNPTASWLLQNMAFFFLPANLMIMEELDLISQVWLELLLIALVSTVVTFAVAAGAASLAIRIQERLLHGPARPEGEASHD